MKDMIEILHILLFYTDPDVGDVKWPFHCEHDVLYIYGVEPSQVSEDDIKRLDKLGVHIDEEFECFASLRYGSC